MMKHFTSVEHHEGDTDATTGYVALCACGWAGYATGAQAWAAIRELARQHEAA
jgi:hypothetical protein